MGNPNNLGLQPEDFTEGHPLLPIAEAALRRPTDELQGWLAKIPVPQVDRFRDDPLTQQEQGEK